MGVELTVCVCMFACVWNYSRACVRMCVCFCVCVCVCVCVAPCVYFSSVIRLITSTPAAATDVSTGVLVCVCGVLVCVCVCGALVCVCGVLVWGWFRDGKS